MSFLHEKVFDPILNSKDAPANIISGNMNKIKLLELRKCRGQYNVIVNNILSYKGECGVWVMYDNHNQLLEVAQTSDVYEELEYDLSWLMKDYSNELNLRKKYAARRLFDFNAKLDTDTTIYARTTKIENEKPVEPEKPEVNEEEKDDVPKTGVESYLGLAILTIIASTAGIVYMKKKEEK